MLAHDIKDAQSFSDYICSQCNLCFRTPNDPGLFCFPKFAGNRMGFLEEFVIAIVQARMLGKGVDRFRQLKTFRKVFCDEEKGVCTVNKGKCNKRKRKRCFRVFSDQILVLDLDDDHYTGKQSKKKKKKNKKKQKAKGKKGNKVHPVEEDEWGNGYGYMGGYGVQAAVKDTPEVTIIGKKKFQNKVDKILDEDTDK